MDIKDYWGVDSSPGSARDTTEKCGHLFATMGATGSATVASYTTDLGDRATVTPGTHPTVNTGAATAPSTPKTPWTPTTASLARGVSLGFSSRGTVLFDSFAAMFGLPVSPTASDKLSISFWISPDGPAQGVILGSPWREILAVPDNSVTSPGLAGNHALDNYLYIGPYAGGGIENPNGDWLRFATAASGALSGPDPNGYSVGQISCDVTDIGSTLVVPSPSYDAGSDGVWFHVMMSMHASGGRVYPTLAINDTVILDGTAPATLAFSNDTGEPWLFPFGAFTPPSGSDAATTVPALRDNAAQRSQDVIAGANIWNIGGLYPDLTSTGLENVLLPEGSGLWGAVTELYIAEGQYIDWSNSTNRNKFHTTDILGTVFLPTDLGAHGQTPTGTKPTMYFTGGPDNFIINRVNGVKCRVYKGTRNSLTLDGRFPGAL